MNIAAIVITYNDGYKFQEWIIHHQEYKDEIYMHIIVDNCSEPEYLKKVEEKFTHSVIIKRGSNGGCTAAYNDGIKYALSHPEVDAIMLIGNDIRLEKGGATTLYNLLMSNKQYGMVAPILLEKDSDTISDFGCTISTTLSMGPFNAGEKIHDVGVDTHEAEALTGGMNLSKREFYEIVGLQDEKLFMYSDEVDMGIRALQNNFKMVATKTAKSWHQHINMSVQSDTRHPFSSYLIGRNKVYLSKKHFNFSRTLYVFLHYAKKAFMGCTISTLKRNDKAFQSNLWLLYGVINGLLGNMKHNKYSQPFTDKIV
ncbi:MAG: glycosyl transferase family 2 [Firmicutes bacterium]|nr:glycosyl transferase family 2 [Bacillota bacterium]